MTSEERKGKIEEILVDYGCQRIDFALSPNDHIHPHAMKTVHRIDSLYFAREKQLIEALKWACEKKCPFAKGGSHCINCKVKQALEGK